MNNPLIDQRVFNKQPWRRELVWVQRNELGVIVGIEERQPASADIDLTLPSILEKGDQPNERS
ncbi:hypothetical protein [Cohnella yongneupensis]|uniref:Uncharacterized protein n=1 Tax=Cohnella yongneupensis TaxID=425006 RepID=A0ABW0QUI2_9BACL